jgi:methionine biosynthesis protein MetW
MNLRLDYQVISHVIEPNARVLDLGCGSGDLLHYLVQTKNVQAQGIELSEDSIYRCVEKGLSVYHSDIDTGLKDYPDKTFDYVLLNQTLQQVKKISYVIDEALRVGKKVIIGFPNFAYIESRFMLFFSGRSPVTETLPFKWHDTPNLRFLSINDFRNYCREKGVTVQGAYFLGEKREVSFWPNLFARNALFVITR